MSLYQVSTRGSRRRRIGAWLRTRWARRFGAATHDAGPTKAEQPSTAEQLSTSKAPRVPQQRPPSRTSPVYPNAYRAR